jgi:hypothetical protein
MSLGKQLLTACLLTASLNILNPVQAMDTLDKSDTLLSDSPSIKSVTKHQDNFFIYPDVAQPQPSYSCLSSLGNIASSVLDSAARLVVKGYGLYTVVALPFVNAVESNLRSGSQSKGVMTNYYTDPVTRENCLPSFHNPNICHEVFDNPEEPYSSITARYSFLSKESSYLEMEEKVETFLGAERKTKKHKRKGKTSHKSKAQNKVSTATKILFQPSNLGIYEGQEDHNDIQSAFIIPFYCSTSLATNNNEPGCSVLLTKKMIINYKNIQGNWNNWQNNTRNFINHDVNINRENFRLLQKTEDTFFMQGGGSYDFPGGSRRHNNETQNSRLSAIRELREELLIHNHCNQVNPNDNNNFCPQIALLEQHLINNRLIPLSIQHSTSGTDNNTRHHRGIYYAWNVGNADLWNALCNNGDDANNPGYQQRKNGVIGSINNRWANNPAVQWTTNVHYPQAPYWPEMEGVECLLFDQVNENNRLNGLYAGVGVENNAPDNNPMEDPNNSSIWTALSRLQTLQAGNLLTPTIGRVDNTLTSQNYMNVRKKLHNAVRYEAEWPRRVFTGEVLNNLSQVVEADNNNRPVGISLSVRLQLIHNLYRDYGQFNQDYGAYISDNNNQVTTLNNRAQQMERARLDSCLQWKSIVNKIVGCYGPNQQESNIRQKLEQTNTLVQRNTEVLPFFTTFSEGQGGNDDVIMIQGRVNAIRTLLTNLQNLGNPLVNEDNINFLHHDKR